VKQERAAPAAGVSRACRCTPVFLILPHFAARPWTRKSLKHIDLRAYDRNRPAAHNPEDEIDTTDPAQARDSRGRRPFGVELSGLSR
jgi:hypothetical protein